jgi:TonB-dependent receptor
LISAVAYAAAGDAPQDLGSALLAFAKRARIELLFDERAVKGRLAPLVRPSQSVEDSLTQLLQGSGLTFRRTDTGYAIFAITPLSPGGRTREPPPGPPNVPEVIVTGFRNTTSRAHTLEMQAVDSVNVILAEDIASFPDLNLAESLQRVPGIAISRDSGEGRQITLRSLDPSLALTQLNGMDVLANTASGMDSRNGVSRTRSFDYSIFASELFDRVTVQKSYAADLDEGGIAGTVQLETAKPFDYPGFKAVLSGKVESNTNAATPTPRLVGLVSDRWGPFGVLTSAAYEIANSNEYGYRNYNWGEIYIDPPNIGPGVSAADAARLTTIGPSEIFAPQADTYSTWYDHRTRIGVTTALQYDPGERLNVELDLVYSELRNNRNDYVLGATGTNALTGNVAGTQVLQADVIQGDDLVRGSFTGVDLRTEANIEKDKTQFQQESLRGSYEATDRLQLSGLLGFSRSDYSLPLYDKVFLELQDQPFSFDDRPGMPVDAYGPEATNPTLWNLMRTDAEEDFISSRYFNVTLNGRFRFDSASYIEFGMNYKRFSNDGSQYIEKVFRNTPTDTPIPESLKGLVPYNTLGQYVVGNVLGTYAYVGQSTDVRSPAFAVPGTAYTIKEGTWAGFLQYDFSGEFLGLTAKGNAGVRYFSTDLTSTGLLVTGASPEEVTDRSRSAGVLPAGNLALTVAHDVVVRLSASRDVSRPALADLAVAGHLTTAPFGGTVSSGNPDLKPYVADAEETSIAFNDGRTFASAGVFFKQLRSFITSQVTVEPYADTGDPLSLLLPGESGSTLFTVTRPVNGPGVSFGGAELDLQQGLAFLPTPLSHLGLIANLTYAEGASPVYFNNVPYKLPLPNLSKYSVNATIYYDGDKWDARLSAAYRSRYLTGEGGDGNIGEGVKDTNNVDFVLHYRTSAHTKISFEAINLTDQHIVQFVDFYVQRPLVNTGSGRTFLLGASSEF